MAQITIITAGTLYADALDSYRFWMRCITFAAGADREPANIMRWAREAAEMQAIMIGECSK
jgi:hypothetical protein